MQITIDTKEYDSRKFSKPWCAKVDFSKSAMGDFKFGRWNGDEHKGSAGYLVISADIGDIVAVGQKDYRKKWNSVSDFFVVGTSLKLEIIGDKTAAYKFYKSQNANEINYEALNSEKRSLMKRVAEIDAILQNSATN